ncbi:MAG: di-heme oxidoredictase family protein [Pseudomonadota bacterium]
MALPVSPILAQEAGLKTIPRTADEQARIQAVITPTKDFSKPERFEARPAGAATVRARTDKAAFSDPSASMTLERELDFIAGNGLFDRLWVSAPSSTRASDGLGPLYNARSCARCHVRNGRGHPPAGPGDNATSMVLQVSIPAPDSAAMAEIEGYLATLPDPTYGGQLQDFALPGHSAEHRLEISYSYIDVQLSDGEVATLRKPTYHTRDLGYGPLHPQAMLSPRIAPKMIGLGLLEAIPEADILANADPQDLDGDGISGRPNIVWAEEHGRPMLGRFGLKAGQPTLRQQNAVAFLNDLGISNGIFEAAWGECTAQQADCRGATHGAHPIDDGFEIGHAGFDLVLFFSRNLGVPARRDMDDPQVLRGKEMFYQAGCIACHTPKFVTHRLQDQPEQSFQLIWPYSDMLLHDMGPGLADGRPEGRATGSEWRTPPLWGIGLTQQVSGHTYFLHDGRARSLLEAVLWHGGEAEAARDRVVNLPKADRAALIRFLESL